MKKIWKEFGYTKERTFCLPCEVTKASFLFFPIIIEKNDEVIIRNRETNKVLVTVYQNQIRPEALQIMRETIIEIMKIWRKVIQSAEISKYNQGTMTAAGYLF